MPETSPLASDDTFTSQQTLSPLPREKENVFNDNANSNLPPSSSRKKRKQTTPVAKPDMNKRGREEEGNSRMGSGGLRLAERLGGPASWALPGSPLETNLFKTRAGCSIQETQPRMESAARASESALVSAEVENSRLRATLEEARERTREMAEEARRRTEIAQRALDESQTTLRRAARNMSRILVDQARLEREAARKRMCAETERLGRWQNVGRMQGRWEGGAEEEAIQDGLTELEKDKSELEREKASLRVLRKQRATTTNQSDADTCGADDGIPESESAAEYALHEGKEHVALVETVIRKSEQVLAERELKLHADRVLHQKETKTLRAQDISRFGVYPAMGGEGRYQILNMIGKGGFSEVFKAYDLHTHSFVAVKLHEIKNEMSEDARENYVKHTLREYSIHRSLKHRRIVRLYDYFTIDESSFGTVLEYCEGVDLDTHLKAHGAMSEKEARGVMVQLWSALRYLNSRTDRVIHYDLKPGNLMYHKGSLKLTDFGLAKIVEGSSSGETVELTSQGAGTYW